LAAVLASSLAGRQGGPIVPTRGHITGHRQVFYSVATFVFFLSFVLFSLVPSFLLRRAETLHIRGSPSLDAYHRAASWPGAPAIALEKYGIALLEAGRFAEAQQAFNRALDGLDTGAVYLGLGVAAFKNGDPSSARAALTACIHRWPSSIEAWYVLMQCTDADERQRLLEHARPWLMSEEIRQLEKIAQNAG
jgi:tetratricopeptide (TPR) repeat protein